MIYSTYGMSNEVLLAVKPGDVVTIYSTPWFCLYVTSKTPTKKIDYDSLEQSNTENDL